MRVTKLIKEYVQKAVAEKMPFPEKPKSELEEKYAELQKDFQKSYCDNLKSFLQEHFDQICMSGYENSTIESQINYIEKSCYLSAPNISTRGMNEWRTKHREVEKARLEKVNEILVTLELGGNKADLDNLLANM